MKTGLVSASAKASEVGPFTFGASDTMTGTSPQCPTQEVAVEEHEYIGEIYFMYEPGLEDREMDAWYHVTAWNEPAEDAPAISCGASGGQYRFLVRAHFVNEGGVWKVKSLQTNDPAYRFSDTTLEGWQVTPPLQSRG